MYVKNPKTTDLDGDALLTQDEAAAILKIAAATLQKWRSTGENNLPFIRVGRACRYRTSDLRIWLERHTKNSNGEV